MDQYAAVFGGVEFGSGWWTFDGKDMKQNVADRSGLGNTGYLQSFTSTTTWPGKLGQTLSFDGTDDYVSVGDPASLKVSGSLSLSA